MAIGDFSREMQLDCEECGEGTRHRSVPVGVAFSCKGTGFPTANMRLKSDRGRKSTEKKQIMVNREKSGEGVGSVRDLRKPMR